MNNIWYLINTSESAYPQPEKDFEFKKISYDQSKYCPICRLGLVQNNPIRLTSDIKNNTYPLLGIHWIFDIIFARPIAKEILESKNVSGIHFTKAVQNSNNKPIENLNQIVFENKIKLKIIDQELTSTICPICHQTKFYYPTNNPITIQKGVLNKINTDFVQSVEFIGESPHHLNLVSQRVFDIITDLKWPGIKLKPISEL